MNGLPVIGYLCLRKELWDRQEANIVCSIRKCIAKTLSCFDVQKTILGEINAFSPLFHHSWILVVFIPDEKCKFLFE